jgi:uncharacterized cupin superfamily protein
MPSVKKLILPALDPLSVEALKGSPYPPVYRGPLEDRLRRRIGNALGLTKFGVNICHLPPGGWSSQRHWHTQQDEFIYVLEGEVTLITDAGEQVLGAGATAGFPAGSPDGHHLVNRSDATAVYLEVGDRPAAEEVHYPDIDMKANAIAGQPSRFTRRDGSDFDW